MTFRQVINRRFTILVFQVRDEWTPPAVPVHLVFPQSRLLAPKLRVFVDFVAPRLKLSLDGLQASNVPESN